MKKIISIVMMLALVMTMFSLPTLAAEEVTLLQESYNSVVQATKNIYKILPYPDYTELAGEDSITFGPMDNVAAADVTVMSPNPCGDNENNRYLTGAAIYKFSAPEGQVFETMRVEYGGRLCEPSKPPQRHASQIEFGFSKDGNVKNFNDPFNRDNQFVYGGDFDAPDYEVIEYIDPVEIAGEAGFCPTQGGEMRKFDCTKTAKGLKDYYLVVRLSSYFDTWGSLDCLNVYATFAKDPNAEPEVKDGWTEDGKSYLKGGKPVTGAQSIDGKAYYFNSKGIKVTNAVVNVGGKYRYYNATGAHDTSVTKYMKVGSNYYYIVKGIAATNTVAKIKSGTKYYYMYFGANGTAQTGVTKYMKVGNYYYYFKKGVAQTNVVDLIKLNGKYYYMYFGANGTAQTGVTKYLKVGTKYYYINKGVAKLNCVAKIKSGTKYYYMWFGAKGDAQVAKTGYYKVGNYYYVFNKGVAYTKAMVKFKAGGADRYGYATTTGALAVNTTLKLNNKTYKANAYGVLTAVK